MISPNVTFLWAVGTMVGSVIGVGVFGLPYVFAANGYVVGCLMLAVLAALNVGLLLMYADVVAHTPGGHRLSGNVAAYLGRRWARFGMGALVVGFWGAMVAFLVAGGHFLSLVLSPGGRIPETVFGLAFLCLVAALSYRGLRFASRVELWLLGLLVFLFLFIMLSALPHAEFANLAGARADGLLTVYGVIFFSLTGGISAIPEMKSILGGSRRLPHAVLTGMFWIVALYALFTLAVVAATGSETTVFAMDGLIPRLGDAFRVIGASLAVVSVLSIFLMSAVELQNSFQFDLKTTKRTAWILAFAPPAVLYILGLRSFVDILGFIGAVVGAALGILVVATYEAMRSSKVCRDRVCLELPRVVSWLIIGVYALGIVLTVTQLFA